MYDVLLGGRGRPGSASARTNEVMKRANADRVGVSMGVRIYEGPDLAETVRREWLQRPPTRPCTDRRRGNDGICAGVLTCRRTLERDAADLCSRW